MVRLLTASPIAENDGDEAPSFLLEETNDYVYIENLDPNPTIDFIENEFGECNKLLAIEERKDPHVETMTMEKLLSSQRHDAFCAEISSGSNVGENRSFSHDDNELLIRKIHPDQKIVVPH